MEPKFKKGDVVNVLDVEALEAVKTSLESSQNRPKGSVQLPDLWEIRESFCFDGNVVYLCESVKDSENPHAYEASFKEAALQMFESREERENYEKLTPQQRLAYIIEKVIPLLPPELRPPDEK